MTGHRVAHPVLISLANLDMDFRMKASNHAFRLLALLPIPGFIVEKEIKGVLEARLIHECLDFVLKPLKAAAMAGTMLRDSFGHYRYCFTPLASYMVDTPESALLAGVAGKTSSITMASYLEFGDSFRHEPRTGFTTLRKLKDLAARVDPNDIKAYVKAARAERLNGVHQPFWRDWPLSDPSVFLTIEPLHHWHKQFWDHDAKWCINVVGAHEINFRFSVLHSHTGFRHFSKGISNLKQVTGREHRDIQRYIIPLIAGAVPRDFLVAVRSLMDFRYLGQALEIDDEGCNKIQAALGVFHAHKQAVIDTGGRRGQHNAIIDNWHIPKLELMHSVAPSIVAGGVPIQWSADVTEHAHITEVKNPARTTNNQDYESQICRYLDRAEKCHRFDLATAVRETGLNICDIITSSHSDVRNEVIDEDALGSVLECIDPVSRLSGAARAVVNYFNIASELQQGLKPDAPLPFRTFTDSSTAFHLTRDPSFKRLTVDEVSTKFNLQDLNTVLGDYVHEARSSPSVFTISGRRRTPGDLPVFLLEVWSRFRLQSIAYHQPNHVLAAQTINASPPSELWTLGHMDPVIFNVDPTKTWPQSGLAGL